MTRTTVLPRAFKPRIASLKMCWPTCASTALQQTNERASLDVWLIDLPQWIVEENDVGVVVQRASDVDALLLSARQIDTLFSDFRTITVG